MQWPTSLPETPGTLVGTDPPPIDLNVLKSLTEFDIDIDYAAKCIEANKHNHVTTTYYLMLKKLLKKGGNSIADARKADYSHDVFLKRTRNFTKLMI